MLTLLVRLLNVPEGTGLITRVVVMGPISFWGNVVPRAFERIGGTILGSGARAGGASWNLSRPLCCCGARWRCSSLRLVIGVGQKAPTGRC